MEAAKGERCRAQGNRAMGKGWPCVFLGWEWLSFQSLFPSLQG